MALKDLLVHLDSNPRCAVRLGLAAWLARRCEASLTAVQVIDLPSAEFFYGAAMPLVSGGSERVVDDMRAQAVAAGAPVEATFRDRLRIDGLEGGYRLVEGHLPATMALHARYADLTVLGQVNPYEPHDGVGRDATVVATVMSSGRPVLVVPFAGDFQTVGDRVLVAWNASREAARAVNDALPLLEKASMVTVLAVNPRHGIGGHGDVPAADIALHLARHGVRAEASHTVANDIPDGEALLSYAADIGADMIVAGAYGHSRAREMVFGGVTRTLLEEMTVPVFLSH
jgi:nucleotide-binding universal stress UspA family protein